MRFVVHPEFLRLHKGVIAIGKRGGKIVAYDSKGKPIYEGTAAFQRYAKQRKAAQHQTQRKGKREPAREPRTWKTYYRDEQYSSIQRWEADGNDWKLVPATWDDPFLVGTQQDHCKKGTKNYTGHRMKQQDEWINSFFTDNKGNPVEPSTAKHAFVMMGGPASGKTTTIKKLLKSGDGDFAAHGYVNVNTDDVKEMMPEYKHAIFGGALRDYESGGKYADMKPREIEARQRSAGVYRNTSAKDAAWIAHQESRDVAGVVLDKALNENLNIIFDGTGSNRREYEQKIRHLRDEGYQVTLVMADLGVDEAVARSRRRAEETGRFVPIDRILIPTHHQVISNFEGLLGKADEFYLFDTRGKDPELRWSGGADQKNSIQHEEWVDEFKKRGRRLMSKQRPDFVKSLSPRKNRQWPKGYGPSDRLKNALAQGSQFWDERDADGRGAWMDDITLKGHRGR